MRWYLIGFIVVLQGCGNLADATKGWTVDKIYQEAKDELNNGAYDKAIGLFEKLEIRAIGTPLSQQAQLEKAYAQYKTGSAAEALVTIDRFMRLHPASPLIDYALYLRGLVNFNGDLGFLSRFTGFSLEDRDQKASKESYATFAELVSRFPNSKYTPDAQARMAYILNTLAMYEIHVARYYMSRKAYLAAANRAQVSLSEYPQSPAREEALSILITAYDALDLSQLRDDAKRVMGINFPKNKLGTPSSSATPSTPAGNPAQKP
ncbi:MAG: outer membrane protein assembly factor BamD [Cytophagales bacterium]|nr:outer membrane protein assembly factor BamD [Cytophagales bacterium]